MKTAADYPVIFDGYGHVTQQTLAKEQHKIEALDEPERAILFACIAAVTAEDEGEQRVVAARKSVRTLEAAFNESVMAFEQANPTHRTQADEVRATTAAQRPGYKPTTDDGSARAKALAAKVATLEAKHADLNADDEPDAVAIAKAAAALARAKAALAADPVAIKVTMDAANEALARARAELFAATSAARGLEIISGNCTDAWRKCVPMISSEQIHRSMVAAEQARKLAAANAPPVIVTEKPIPSELDRIMQSRGKTKTNRMPAYHGPR